MTDENMPNSEDRKAKNEIADAIESLLTPMIQNTRGGGDLAGTVTIGPEGLKASFAIKGKDGMALHFGMDLPLRKTSASLAEQLRELDKEKAQLDALLFNTNPVETVTSQAGDNTKED